MQSPDMASIIAGVARATGLSLTLERRFDVGSGAGAYSVLEGDETPRILKWWPNTPVEQERYALRSDRIPILRALGWPIPPLLHHGMAGDILFEIWDVAPGEPGVASPASAAVVAGARDLVASARGTARGDGHDWPSWLRTWITSRLDCLPATASQDVTALIAMCRTATAVTDVPRGRDLIHGDFTPANLLVEDDRISAVVDLDDCRDGDGTLDLIGIVWDLEGWEKASPDVVDQLWADILQRVDADYGRLLLAYWIAGTLAWATGTDEEVAKTSLAYRAWGRFSPDNATAP